MMILVCSSGKGWSTTKKAISVKVYGIVTGTGGFFSFSTFKMLTLCYFGNNQK